MGAQTNTQRSFSNLSKSLPTLKHLFDHDPFTNKPFGLTNIALQDEILSMVSFCSSMALSTTSHELKRFKLTHLFTVIKTSKKPLHHDILSSVMSLISVNIFRPLPPPSPAFPITSTLAEENEVVVSSTLPSLNWLLLELVYEILLWLVINIDTQTLEKHIDHTFLLGLLSLFDSEEAKERESLKNVFHQIYYKLTKYRSFMRKAMSGVFLEYIFETERHNGIAEMLEIWGSIINGFAVPLKEEHRVFLKRILIPLHKVKGMQNFNKQLGYCVYQFVEKESELGGFIVRKIMKYWPQANSQKEIKLIEELEDLVEKLDPKLYRDLALPFCSHMTKCFKSLNSMVRLNLLVVFENV
ncbi:hypothetical protein IC582_024957 [Cucumis melo]